MLDLMFLGTVLFVAIVTDEKNIDWNIFVPPISTEREIMGATTEAFPIR